MKLFIHEIIPPPVEETDHVFRLRMNEVERDSLITVLLTGSMDMSEPTKKAAKELADIFRTGRVS